MPVSDLDGDGLADFLALVSNEHESVEAFLNQGGGKFRRRVLWRAPDLAFGSSGIRLCDLNGDGADDVLYINGDTFDNQYLCPWFGVQWLENVGGVNYRRHRIADLPGVGAVSADDFDRDGDLDLLAVCFLPGGVKPRTVDFRVLPSIVLYEQAAPGRFVPHTLEKGLPCHASLVVADFNGDGRLDFAVGRHFVGGGASAFEPSWGAVWWNRGLPDSPSK